MILFCANATLQAQENVRSEPRWWFGAAGASNLNFYRGTTQMLNSTLTTPTAFRKGSGSGFYAGLLAEYRPHPIWGGMLYVGYDDRRGSFDDVRTPCNCPMTLATTISYFSIEPSLRFAPFSSGFYLFAGPRIGFNSAKSFTYTRDGNPGVKTKGDLSDMHSTVFSGQIGVGYDVSLTSPDARTQVAVSPFVSFHPYFGANPRSVENWNVSTLRSGIAIKFGRGVSRSYEAIPAVSEREVSFSIRAPKSVPVQRRVRETFPLRNYVFFDEGSSEVPSRYVRLTSDQAASFKEEQLQEVQPQDTTGRSRRQMTVYSNILNILGDRMRSNPGTKVSLTGATGKGPEDGRTLAESIKQYLVSVFGIDAGNITTHGSDKPRIPSEHPGGTLELGLLVPENRRVDIESNSPELLMQVGGPPDVLRPVQIVAVQEDPLDSYVLFNVTGAKTLLSSWSLEVKDERGDIQRFGPFTRDQENIPGKTILGNRVESDFKVTMLGQTKSGHSVKKEGAVHLVRRDEPKPEGLRFSILFEFDQSKTVATYERFLQEMVVPLIAEGSTVIIHGHTDVIGEEDYNLKLSRNRAQDAQRVIERALSKSGKRGVTFESFGFGEDVSLAPFDNNLAEERFYNRTVIIDIVPGT
jgi:outer membrane protein OmpA-like peptidoglycan-associated protein